MQGERIAAIALQVGISPRTVARDIERARATWKETTQRKYDELLPEKLAQLEEIRAESWAAWRKSREPKQRITRSEQHGETTTVEQQVGDPRFLSQLERVLRLECELRGMLDDKQAETKPAEIVEVVIESRLQHEQFKALTMQQLANTIDAKAVSSGKNKATKG